MVTSNQELIKKIIDQLQPLLEGLINPLQQGQIKILSEVSALKNVQQEQDKKQDIVIDTASHTTTALEALDNKLDATTKDLRREIKQQQKPRHID